MTRRNAVLAALLVAVLLPTGSRAATGGITVSVDRARVTTGIGQTFVFRSTIANPGPRPAVGLIAHLNVLSLHDGVYVDPEDWSSRRTHYLPPIPPGGSTTTTWHLEAVNSGSFGVFVAVLPESGAPQPPATGPTIRVDIAQRQTLNSGGILPLALGIPALLGLLSLGLRLRRRA
jgi:hypothetical protein